MKNIHKISAFKNSMKMCAPVGEIVSPQSTAALNGVVKLS